MLNFISFSFDGIRRWRLWEIIRIRCGHEGRTLMNGIRPLQELWEPLLSFSTSPRKDIMRSQLSAVQERSSPELGHTGNLDLGLLVSRTETNKCLLFVSFLR